MLETAFVTTQSELILEFGDLDHRTGLHTDVGQLKINNIEVMCQMSMKLSAMFEQNPPHAFDKIVEKHITTKTAFKCHGHTTHSKN